MGSPPESADDAGSAAAEEARAPGNRGGERQLVRHAQRSDQIGGQTAGDEKAEKDDGDQGAFGVGQADQCPHLIDLDTHDRAAQQADGKSGREAKHPHNDPLPRQGQQKQQGNERRQGSGQRRRIEMPVAQRLLLDLPSDGQATRSNAKN